MPRKSKKISAKEQEDIEEFEDSKSNKEERKISHIFVTALSLISILGFMSIISTNIFSYSIDPYIEPLWLIIMGLAFIIEASPVKLFHQIRNRLDERNFNRITTLVIGLVSFISGTMTLPYFNFNHFMFSAMKGLVSFVAIIFIIVETWVIKQ